MIIVLPSLILVICKNHVHVLRIENADYEPDAPPLIANFPDEKPIPGFVRDPKSNADFN